MADTASLDVQMRNIIGKQVKQLRQQGLLPATMYGKGFAPLSIQIDDRTFNKLYRDVGRTSLIDVQVPGQPKQSVLIQDIQRHPVTRTILHADLRVVDLRVELSVDVPIHIVGESPLVKNNEAGMTQVLSTLNVRALPANMPQNIEIDVSVLDSLDKSIHVADLPTDDTYTITNDAEQVVVALTVIREEEEEPVEEETDAADVPTVGDEDSDEENDSDDES